MAVRSLFAVLCSSSLLFHRYRALIGLRCRDATRGPTGRFRVASLQKPVPRIGSSVSRPIPRRRFAPYSAVRGSASLFGLPCDFSLAQSAQFG
jgi:hypothetical protein